MEVFFFYTRIAQKAENLNFAGESLHGKKVGNTIQTTHPVCRRRVKHNPDYKRFVYTTPTDFHERGSTKEIGCLWVTRAHVGKWDGRSQKNLQGDWTNLLSITFKAKLTAQGFTFG